MKNVYIKRIILQNPLYVNKNGVKYAKISQAVHKHTIQRVPFVILSVSSRVSGLFKRNDASVSF